jgi:hypothetical protein
LPWKLPDRLRPAAGAACLRREYFAKGKTAKRRSQGLPFAKYSRGVRGAKRPRRATPGIPLRRQPRQGRLAAAAAQFRCRYSPRGKRLLSSSTFRSMWLRM